MKPISQNIKTIKPFYDVIVIGSGYGGSITASRLSRAGKKVAVLERGREILPGDYPDTQYNALREMQINSSEKQFGSATGLFDLHINTEQNVLVGCGLGGTSLINANVALAPEPEVFQDSRWPIELREDQDGLLKKGFALAADMLKPQPYPESAPRLDKLEAHRKSAAALGKSDNFYQPPLTITFDSPENGINHVGVEQSACQHCGDCVTGCNYGAKNTTLMNYLPDARNFGAEIFCTISVQSIQKVGHSWQVLYKINDKNDTTIHSVKADLVMLAAGTLGSTEILLRSKQNGLLLSNALGKNFSGNGDILGFAYNCDEPINAIGSHATDKDNTPTVGPCISSIIDLREGKNWRKRMVIEEGTVPAALASMMPMAMAVAAGLMGDDTDTGKMDKIKEGSRVALSLLNGPYSGATQNMQTYLIMSHDNANGSMYLENDRIQIDWPELGTQENFEIGNHYLRQATEALGGTYVKNPTWSKHFNQSLITVHPLGGCIMADSSDHGACNHKGQLFSDTTGSDVYTGLYLSDGAIIPSSLAINPLLTISALTERCCLLIAKDRYWTIQNTQASSPSTQQVKQHLTPQPLNVDNIN